MNCDPVTSMTLNINTAMRMLCKVLGITPLNEKVLLNVKVQKLESAQLDAKNGHSGQSAEVLSILLINLYDGFDKDFGSILMRSGKWLTFNDVIYCR